MTGALSELQIGLLHALRREFAKHGTVTYQPCLSSHRQSADCMQHLFNPREAWRIAGLLNPGEEAGVPVSIPPVRQWWDESVIPAADQRLPAA
jgi:hypothetical protein